MDNYHKTMAIMALMMSLRYVHWDHRTSSWSEAVGVIDLWKSFLFSSVYDFLLADGAGRRDNPIFPTL